MRFSAAMVLGVALAACGGSGNSPEDARASGSEPDASSIDVDAPPAAAEAVITGAPPATGTPVIATLGAEGGTATEPRSGMTLELRAGSVAADTQVTLTPIANLVASTAGDGVELALADGASLSRRPVVRFSYGADVVDPSGLFLALQADDGSWHAVFPLRVDAASRTISAELPLPGESFKRPASSTRPYRIVRWTNEFFMRPAQATVKVGQTVTLIPYAVGVSPDERPPLPCDEGEDCLPWIPRLVNVPFTNDKPGYIRVWYVNTVVEGNATLGTVRPNRTVGAVYTAPARKPDPSVVDVELISEDREHVREASAKASIQIVDDDEWVGSIRFEGEGSLTEVIDEPSHGCAPYQSCSYHSETTSTVTASGSIQFAGRAPFPDSATLPAVAVAAEAMESTVETSHRTAMTTSGCVETTDIHSTDTASGSISQLPVGSTLFAVLFISGGRYMITATVPFWDTAGSYEEHADYFNCLDGATSIDSSLPRTSIFVAPIGIIEGTIDPAHPNELRGSKPVVTMEGDVVVGYTVTWEFTRP